MEDIRRRVGDDFTCPISLEVMRDPVIVSSGHTFDRCSIQKWIDSGHNTCPITKIPFSNPPYLIPNHALRSLINSTFAPQFHNITLNPPQITHNLDPTPLSHIFHQTHSDAKLKEKALKFLLNLTLNDDNKVGLVAEGVIGYIVAVLRGPGVANDGSRAVGATIITSLAVVEVNKATIGAYPFAIKSLISLLGGGNGRERKEAATALYTLCTYPENRKRSVEFGCVPVLVNLACNGLERAVEVLGLLAKCKEGRAEMVKLGNCVTVLIRFLKNGSPRGVQYALSTLGLLCMYSEGVRGEVLGEGVFEYCVGLLEDESEKVRRNASNLIQVLRGKRSMS